MTKEERKAYRHQYYLAHKEEATAQALDWYHKHVNEDLLEHKRTLANEARADGRWKRNQLNYLSDDFKWEDVEGYDGFTTNVVVHHRLEAWGYSVQRLKELGWYYDCCPYELLCMTQSQHAKFHSNLNHR